MSDARQAILQRLSAHSITTTAATSSRVNTSSWSREAMITHFMACQQAVKGEVVRLNKEAWLSWLAVELPKRGLRRVLVGNGDLANQLQNTPPRGISVSHYSEQVEQHKSRLFNEIDVSITDSHAGIAETGSLVLWPDGDEPRLMSLVPPVHIALLDADKLYQSFAALIAEQKWAERAEGMPTNALLISGPSKTADIEQTLAFGIHGPQQLITLLLDADHHIKSSGTS